LAVYQKQTAPVLDWYRKNGTKVATIDAVGPVQDVTARALGVLAT
jgi:adenylate kinase family enzyme